MNPIISQNPKITIQSKYVSKDSISPVLYGGFIEFLNHFVNGPRGHWAQEIMDRGFDIAGNNVSEEWPKFGDKENNENSWELVAGGYNKNGLYAQKMTKSGNNGEIGISQKIFLNDSVGHNFYIYHKGMLSDDSLYISIRSLSGKETYFKEGIDIPSNDWKKSTVYIPPLRNRHSVLLVLSFENEGYVILDEASLMPENNIGGMRKEFYDAYKFWNPGIIRYPGGWFADRIQNKLSYAIGEIDQRKSPNIMVYGVNQRMDFGLDEFVSFCKSLNIEPHITVNFETGTAQEAVEYLEYCNGDSNTKMGKVRSENGHPEPYGIKYWEVGNEQWQYEAYYAKGYLAFYDLMKNSDSSITIIIDGNHWAGYNNFKTLFSIVGDKCDIYGYHPTLVVKKNPGEKDEDIFLAANMSSTINERLYFDSITTWLKKWNLHPKVKQGMCEWWSDYGSPQDWLLDTNFRNYSLESGLLGASLINSAMKYPETMVIGERTCGLGMFNCSIDSITGKRTFFYSPTLYALSMISNHRGKYLLQSDVSCDTYNPPPVNSISVTDNVPYIDAVVSASTDTLYINIVSRYANQYKDFKIDFEQNLIGRNAVVYELYSDSFLDANTGTTPKKVVPKVKKWVVNNTYRLPPHSFSILAIPCSGIVDVEDTKNKFNEEFFVYPNPSSGFVNIKPLVEIYDDWQIEFYSTLGNKLLSKVANAYDSNYKLDISNLPQGIYFLRLKLNNKFFTYKILYNQ